MPVKLSAAVLSALKLLGSDIRSARIRRCMTMEDLAERVGVTRITISNAEKGKHTVSIGVYATILLVFGKLETLSNIIHISKDVEYLNKSVATQPKRVRRKD